MNATEILSRDQLKTIFGGGSDSGGGCGYKVGCDGVIVKTVMGLTKSDAIYQATEAWNDADFMAYYSNCGSLHTYWCCASC